MAQTALALGNLEIPERCYQANKALEKLNFFYAATGSTDKMQKMGQLAERLEDPMLKYNCSLLNADVSARVRCLVDAGQLALAYLTARTHNLTEMVEFIEQEMQDSKDIDAVQVMDETEKRLN